MASEVAAAWDAVSKAANIAQILGVDALGLCGSVKQAVDSAVALPGEAKLLSDEVERLAILNLFGRIVQNSVATSDDPSILILSSKLDKELKNAESIIPEALRTPAVSADPMTKQVEASKDGINVLVNMLNAAINSWQLKVVDERLLGLQAAVQELVAATRTSEGSHSTGTAESLLQKLTELAHADHPRIVQYVEMAPHGGAKWSPAPGSAPDDKRPADHRGFLVGEYELQNNFKIRVTMTSQKTLYFHIVTTVSSEDQPPKLLYPEKANSNNELSPKCKRKFPVYGDEFITWMVTKTVPRRQAQKFSAYFVFTAEKRHGTGDARLTIMDMEKILSSGEVIVEVLDFLVK